MTKKKRYLSDGTEVTEELLDQFAEEAERGFELSQLRPRVGRPPMGAEKAVVFQVRLEPELHFALMRCAEEAGVTPSEMARRILRRELK
jgi:CRISPR-associated endonuclease/helicase Cas3